MKCPKCGATVPAWATFCPGCGAQVSTGEQEKTPEQVTPQWLGEIFKRLGYSVELTGDDTLRVKHETKPNMIVTVRHSLGLITLQHYWNLKKSVFGGQGNMMSAVNRANSSSWRSTFYIDKDGDLGVSSYMALTSKVSGQDVIDFLEKGFDEFMQVVATSNLHDYLK
jgi:hypothetical protein